MYKIIGVAPGTFRETLINEFDSQSEAKEMLKEYRFRFGGEWRIFMRVE
tara:strand:- start:1095 stop:1241 length:147 start_codon:yes stop_codon:yes gene_type:complete